MPNINQQISESNRLPAAAYLLTGCVAIVGSNSLVLGPIAPEVAHAFGSTTSTVMAATAAFGLATATSALLFARHIDRLGAWRVLRASMAVLALALLSSAAATGVVMLSAAQAVAGLATGVALPAIYSNAAAIAPPGRESRTIGAVLTGWTLSLVAGVSLSAVLAQYVQWRAVYAAVAVLAAVAFAILSYSKHPRAVAAESAPMPTEALKIPGVTPLLIVCGAFMSAFYGIYGFLGDHLHNGLGRPLSANGFAALAYGLGFGLAAFLDKFVDRVGPRRTMPIALCAVGAIYLCMALTGAGFVGLLATVFVWGLVNHIAFNALIVRLTAIDPARRGTIMGLNSAVTYLAVFAGTTGFGAVYTSFGFIASAILAAGLTFVSAMVGAFARKGQL
ncbi:MFS transporter [Luteimonas gilva]|uniref:MFS transporter n=1 Tax=Luteimonas gilva TaxID=2572684 RepID=A0A4V5ZPZ9_9GAMM|nr:MFS transporter [Luteimonas gilva]TKR29503.1 MFS transporter [Luteimonas gilva]